ncbi:hypothetical protein SUGI_0091540 [Cryptomeria japonica]|nr:hypothetical protein SUGI_0091540 [Cryptomeria japonica]
MNDEGLLLVGVVVLAMCIFFDVCMACYRGAKWVPGYFVPIYALCLQLIGSLDVQNVSVGSTDQNHKLEELVSKQLSIYSSRLVLFVFVGYLVPDLASTNAFWTNIAALFTTLSIHIAIELSVALHSLDSETDKVVKNPSGTWLISSVGFLLAVESPENNNESWDTCRSEMIKSWIIARVSQPEYVLVRSFFSLEVACLVTVNVVFMGIKVIYLRSQLHGSSPLFTIQCIFIILGWFMVSYRCFLRYGNLETLTSRQKRIGLARSRAGVYDIFSLMQYVSPVFVLRRKILKDVENSICRSVLQIGFGLLSFMYSLPSVIFFLGWIGAIVILFACRPMMKFRREWCFSAPREVEDFQRYKEALELVCMPGDEAESLWVANENSFIHIKHWIEQAYERGKSCEKLQKVIGSRLAQNIPLMEDIKELLEPLESVKRYFPLLNDSFRRITASVLLMDDDSVSEDQQHSMDKLKRDVRRAFEDAEDLIDFLDCPDNVGISLDFFKISNLEAFMLTYASIRPSKTVRFHFRESSTVANAVQDKSDKAQSKLDTCKLLGASSPHIVDTDWSRTAEDYAIYKVCKLILDRHPVPESVEQMQNYLINMVADLIAICVTESPKMLVERSRKWAAEFKEDKIYAAIELAGFAWGVIDGVNAASPSTKIDYGGLFSYA